MLILSCDIDNTLTGDDGALKILNEAIKALRKTRPLTLIYNTGRGFSEFTRLRNTSDSENFKGLLLPDFLVCACGSEIYKPEDGEYKLDQVYERIITQTYSKEKIVKVMREYDELVSEKLAKAVKTDRHRHCITLHKHSVETAEGVGESIRQKLNAVGVRAELVLETNVEWLDGNTYIDALPYACSKASALDYLVETIEPQERKTVLWCGDSRNDKTMLNTPYLGIIVGNAQDVLKNNANSKLHYIAQAKYAAGILEGLWHFQTIKSPKGWSLGQRIGLGVALSVGVVALMLQRKRGKWFI